MCVCVCLSVRHRLAEFLTDRARSGTNRFRIFRAVSRTKKILKKKDAVDGRHLVIANPKKKVALGVVPIDSEFPGEQNGQKKF